MTATTWSVIVPVKAAANAKTRLAAEYGAWRPRLARAFALDTIRAAVDCERTSSVVVVTDDRGLDEIVATDELVSVVADRGQGDLNGAIRLGLAAVSPAHRVAAITSDLPSLTGSELADTLDLAGTVDASVVPDSEGIGTTMLAAASPAMLRPRFGRESLRLHVADGSTELTVTRLSGSRRDVDLPEHLCEAIELGVGRATSLVIEDMRSGTGPDWVPAPLRRCSSDVSAS